MDGGVILSDNIVINYREQDRDACLHFLTHIDVAANNPPKDIGDFISPTASLVITSEYNYRFLAGHFVTTNLVGCELNKMYTVPMADGSYSFVLIDSKYSAGSVSVLIKGPKKLILYTGNFAYYSDFLKNPSIKSIKSSQQVLDHLYLDGLYYTRETSFDGFDDIVQGVVSIIKESVPNKIVSIYAEHYSLDPIIGKIASELQFQEKILTDQPRFESMERLGYHQFFTTSGSYKIRILKKKEGFLRNKHGERVIILKSHKEYQHLLKQTTVGGNFSVFNFYHHSNTQECVKLIKALDPELFSEVNLDTVKTPKARFNSRLLINKEEFETINSNKPNLLLKTSPYQSEPIHDNLVVLQKLSNSKIKQYTVEQFNQSNVNTNEAQPSEGSDEELATRINNTKIHSIPKTCSTPNSSNTTLTSTSNVEAINQLKGKNGEFVGKKQESDILLLDTIRQQNSIVYPNNNININAVCCLSPVVVLQKLSDSKIKQFTIEQCNPRNVNNNDAQPSEDSGKELANRIDNIKIHSIPKTCSTPNSLNTSLTSTSNVEAIDQLNTKNGELESKKQESDILLLNTIQQHNSRVYPKKNININAVCCLSPVEVRQKLSDSKIKQFTVEQCNPRNVNNNEAQPSEDSDKELANRIDNIKIHVIPKTCSTPNSSNTSLTSNSNVEAIDLKVDQLNTKNGELASKKQESDILLLNNTRQQNSIVYPKKNINIKAVCCLSPVEALQKLSDSKIKQFTIEQSNQSNVNNNEAQPSEDSDKELANRIDNIKIHSIPKTCSTPNTSLTSTSNVEAIDINIDQLNTKNGELASKKQESDILLLNNTRQQNSIVYPKKNINIKAVCCLSPVEALQKLSDSKIKQFTIEQCNQSNVNNNEAQPSEDSDKELANRIDNIKIHSIPKTCSTPNTSLTSTSNVEAIDINIDQLNTKNCELASKKQESDILLLNTTRQQNSIVYPKKNININAVCCLSPLEVRQKLSDSKIKQFTVEQCNPRNVNNNEAQPSEDSDKELANRIDNIKIHLIPKTCSTPNSSNTSLTSTSNVEAIDLKVDQLNTNNCELASKKQESDILLLNCTRQQNSIVYPKKNINNKAVCCLSPVEALQKLSDSKIKQFTIEQCNQINVNNNEAQPSEDSDKELANRIDNIKIHSIPKTCSTPNTSLTSTSNVGAIDINIDQLNTKNCELASKKRESDILLLNTTRQQNSIVYPKKNININADCCLSPVEVRQKPSDSKIKQFTVEQRNQSNVNSNEAQPSEDSDNELANRIDNTKIHSIPKTCSTPNSSNTSLTSTSNVEAIDLKVDQLNTKNGELASKKQESDILLLNYIQQHNSRVYPRKNVNMKAVCCFSPVVVLQKLSDSMIKQFTAEKCNQSNVYNNEAELSEDSDKELATRMQSLINLEASCTISNETIFDNFVSHALETFSLNAPFAPKPVMGVDIIYSPSQTDALEQGKENKNRKRKNNVKKCISVKKARLTNNCLPNKDCFNRNAVSLGYNTRSRNQKFAVKASSKSLCSNSVGSPTSRLREEAKRKVLKSACKNNDDNLLKKYKITPCSVLVSRSELDTYIYSKVYKCYFPITNRLKKKKKDNNK